MTSNGIEYRILPHVSVSDVHDNPESEEPTSYLIKASIGLGDDVIETRWSALLDTAHQYTNAGWESSDQWVAWALSERAHKYNLSHSDLVEIGEAVIAYTNADPSRGTSL